MSAHRTILLDVDGVLADFVGAVRSTVAEVGHRLGEVTQPDFTAQLAVEHPEVHAHYIFRSAARNWCTEIEPYPGAARFVEQLRQHGEVVAVTAPLRHCPTWESERRAWLRRHVGITDVISTRRKDLVYGDVLVEDSYDNLAKWWARLGHEARCVLVGHAYNKQRNITSKNPGRFPCADVCDYAGLYDIITEGW